MWTPSFGLLGVGAYLEEMGFPPQILDCTTFKRPWTDLARKISEVQPDIIGITAGATCLSPEALQSIVLAKRLSPRSVIVAGGSHFTLGARSILREVPEIDYILMGEGEESMAELVSSIAEDDWEGIKGIRGLAFSEDGEVVVNPVRPLIPELDTLPLPAYHLIDVESDAYYWHGMGRRAFGLSTSRGCGDRCAYCSETVFWQGYWRARSGERVVEEMAHLNRRYGKTLFVFNENSFNWSRKRVEEFLEELGKSGLKVDFWFQSRVKDIIRDEDLMPEFKRLGLYEVMLGVESINSTVLDRYEKRQDRDMAQKAINILRENGIMVMANVMFGDWFDSEETLREVFQFLKKQSDFLILTMTTPLPGTPYYGESMEAGRIVETDLGKYDFMHPILSTRYLSADEVELLHKAYLKKYYTQPRIFSGALVSRNPFRRMAYRLIMRYVWENATRRQWRQPNFQDYEEFLHSFGTT
ncbi:MAG: B12-binding domain-containing radical SAM protein [Thermodesulfobacteriota bacterium]